MEAAQRGLYPELVDLPEALAAVRFEDWRGTMILIDRSLNGPERTAALAHELIHDERGGCIGHGPKTWTAVRAREELQVDREVARRLVPLARLADYCDRMADLDEDVAPWTVGEEFDVSDDVARTALELLKQHERQR